MTQRSLEERLPGVAADDAPHDARAGAEAGRCHGGGRSGVGDEGADRAPAGEAVRNDACSLPRTIGRG